MKYIIYRHWTSEVEEVTRKRGKVVTKRYENAVEKEMHFTGQNNHSEVAAFHKSVMEQKAALEAQLPDCNFSIEVVYEPKELNVPDGPHEVSYGGHHE